MTSEEDVFESAIALPEAERIAYLDNVCAGDPESRRRIEALLQSHEVRGFMDDRGPRSKTILTSMEPGADAWRLHSAAPMGKEDEGVVRRISIPGELTPGPHILAISVHNTAQPGSGLRLGGVTLVELAPSGTSK